MIASPPAGPQSRWAEVRAAHDTGAGGDVVARLQSLGDAARAAMRQARAQRSRKLAHLLTTS